MENIYIYMLIISVFYILAVFNHRFTEVEDYKKTAYVNCMQEINNKKTCNNILESVR